MSIQQTHSKKVNQLLLELENVKPYPCGVVEVPELIKGTSFFPGGMGLKFNKSQDEKPDMPIGKIMIVGQDFYSKKSYQEILERSKKGYANPSQSLTVYRLNGLLNDVGIDPQDCFFTNFFMGLREGDKNSGTFPGAKDKSFINKCWKFFLIQIREQKPRLILLLGTDVPKYIARESGLPSLKVWKTGSGFQNYDAKKLSFLRDVQLQIEVDKKHTCSIILLNHPGDPNYKNNIALRRFDGKEGEDAVVTMIRKGLEKAKLDRFT